MGQWFSTNCADSGSEPEHHRISEQSLVQSLKHKLTIKAHFCNFVHVLVHLGVIYFVFQDENLEAFVY